MSANAHGGLVSAHNISVEEAATRLGKSVQTVRRLLAAGAVSGQKIGGRWLVHGDKLPTSPPVSSTSSAGASSAKLDVATALRYVLRADRRELWIPDVLNWEDYREGAEAVLLSSRSKCTSGKADPFEVVEVPKGALLSRAGTLLSLEDRIAYHALCASFAQSIDGHLSDRVFSSRLREHESADFFKSGIDQHRAFEGATTGAAKAGSWIVTTDLVSYFETISHQLLFEDLQNLGVSAEVSRPLRDLLREWRRDSKHGLPIGPDASRLLGNFFMAHIDESMLAEGFDYYRFMDDIRIVTQSENDALRALRRFEVLCRARGLIVSGAKTSVTPYVPGETKEDTTFARADYLFINGAIQARSALRDLFNDALTETSVKKRHAKFALLRLGSLVDRGVLKKLLTRLNQLTEVSKDSAFYLRSFVSETNVQDSLTKYLTEKREPGVETYQLAWLFAVMLEVLGEPPTSWIDYAETYAWDANQPTFLRGLAFNLVALGRRPKDIKALREFATTNYDPALVRCAAVALTRVDCLDKTTRQRMVDRMPQLQPTVTYLQSRNSLPSLMQEGMWSRVRKIPTS